MHEVHFPTGVQNNSEHRQSNKDYSSCYRVACHLLPLLQLPVPVLRVWV